MTLHTSVYLASHCPGLTAAHVSICFGPKMGLVDIVAIAAIAVRPVPWHGASGAAE